MNQSILIIGAGPSGLTLATELTRRGIGCTIVDKAAGPAPLHESRALAFNARSQALLRASGVTGKIVAKGHAVNNIHLCWRGSLRQVVSMDHDISTPHSSGTITIIRQGEIERILISHLEAQGVSVQWNTELINFSETDTSITASLRNAAGVMQAQTARYLAGCDGAHSQVRKQGGYTFDGESDSQRWTLADIAVSGKDVAHTLIADLRPGQAFATMPIESNIVRLIHNGPDILTAHPIARYGTEVHWQSEFTVSYRLVKRYHRGRSFLCGDAAHIHSPVGGRGMNLGIEDAASLAWLLDTGCENQYSGLRLPVAQKVLSMTHRQTSQMNSASVGSTLAKKYGPALLSIPYIRRTMQRAVLGLDTPTPAWLSDS